MIFFMGCWMIKTEAGQEVHGERKIYRLKNEVGGVCSLTAFYS